MACSFYMFTYSVNLTLIWAVGVYMVRSFMGLHSAAFTSDPENREQDVEHLVGTRAGILSAAFSLPQVYCSAVAVRSMPWQP